jgi:hypothetical protein
MRILTLAAVFGIYDDDEKESEGVKFGIVVNKNHPRFMQLKVGNTYIDLTAGMARYWSDTINYFSDVKLDPKALREGEIVEKKRTAYDKKSARKQFIYDQVHANIQTIFELADQETRSKADLSRMDWVNSLDTVLTDAATTLMARDIEKIFTDGGVDNVQAMGIIATMFQGANVFVEESPEARDKRIEELNLRYLTGPSEE